MFTLIGVEFEKIESVLMPRRSEAISNDEKSVIKKRAVSTSGIHKRQHHRRRISKIKPIGQLAAEKKAAMELKENVKSKTVENSSTLKDDHPSHGISNPHVHTLSEDWNLSGDEDPEDVEHYKLSYEDDRTGKKISLGSIEDDYDYPRPEANEI